MLIVALVVCLFIKNVVLESYEVNILYNKVEDVSRLQLSHKTTSDCVNCCVCYLSPEGSSRQCDPHEFFNHLLPLIYVYQNSGPFMLCGDFNARCGSDADYIVKYLSHIFVRIIPVIDDIEPRSIVDYRKNSYGDIFIDFLNNCNCIVLNGRGKGSNDYTSISSRGVAVVDYTIVHQDLLPLCDNLCVIRASELFHQTGLVGCCDTRHNIPDHSLLYWNVALQNHNCNDYSENDNNSYRIKYDVTNTPDDFMCDESCMKNMNEITAKCSNLGVTESYKQFCVV